MELIDVELWSLVASAANQQDVMWSQEWSKHHLMADYWSNTKRSQLQKAVEACFELLGVLTLTSIDGIVPMTPGGGKKPYQKKCYRID